MEIENIDDNKNNDGTVNIESSLDGLRTLFSRPILFPISVSLVSRKVRFAIMNRFCYQRSNFLDVKRAVTHGAMNIELDWLLQKYRLNHWVHRLPHFIFHTAFCCSTLLTRCIDARFKSLVLREPRVLNILNRLMSGKSSGKNRETRHLEEMLLALLFRRFSDDEPVLIKPNDICNISMAKLFAQSASAVGLFLYSDIESFIISALKNAQRRDWLRKRFQFMVNHFPCPNEWHRLKVGADNDGCIAAAIWSQNVSIYTTVYREFGPERVRSLNCRTFLAQPHETLLALGKHYALVPRDPATATVDDLLSVHAKNPRLAYNGNRREAEYRDWHQRLKHEIEQGQKWALAHLGEEQLPGNLAGQL